MLAKVLNSIVPLTLSTFLPSEDSASISGTLSSKRRILFEAEDDSLISGTKVKTFPACTLPKVTLWSVKGVSYGARCNMKKKEVRTITQTKNFWVSNSRRETRMEPYQNTSPRTCSTRSETAVRMGFAENLRKTPFLGRAQTPQC